MVATFGIEEELLVVDAATGELVPSGPRLVDAARSVLGDLVVSELNRCQVETNTRVCSTLDDAASELDAMRSALVRAGGSVGVLPVPLATHPWSRWRDQAVNTGSEHYRTLLADYQQVAREMVICGCHIHVGVDDPDDRIRAMYTVTPWLPALLALSANSPWWQGSDTGYSSYRAIVWKAWPTATMPPRLRDHRAFERLVESLLAVEAIDTPSAVYWWVRPSANFPTLEYRVADTCLRADDAVTLAGLTRALTATAVDERWEPDETPPIALLDTSFWRAARYGLEGTLVDPSTSTLRPSAEVIRRLLDRIRPGLEAAGDRERVVEGVERILAEGNGARVQRSALDDGRGDRADRMERIAAITAA